MVSRSGASDFVTRQSHQNWFRNQRFLNTSLGSIVGAVLCLGAWSTNRLCVLPHALRATWRSVMAGAYQKQRLLRFSPDSQGVTAIRSRSAIGTQTRVGVFGGKQAVSTRKNAARNARRQAQRQIRQRAPWLTDALAIERREILKNRRFLSRLFGSFFLGGKKELRSRTSGITPLQAVRQRTRESLEHKNSVIS